MAPDVTEDMVFTALRTFLLAVLPAGAVVVQGQQNRVPQPVVDNYVIMTAMSRTHLSSSYHGWAPDEDTIGVTRSTQVDIQMDVYGPSSTDNAQVIATLLRDDYACRAMAGSGVQPLYCDDGVQMPLVNGEHQYEDRWKLHAQLQIDPTVSTPAQFADTLSPSLVEADR